MAGFLTYYLFGMESCDMLSDNYIHEVIKKNNHAFLLGLQGNNLLSFNPHTLSKRGLSYRTASLTLRNQEYAAFFNNMLDTLSGMADQEREAPALIWHDGLYYCVTSGCTGWAPNSMLYAITPRLSGRIFRPSAVHPA